VIEYTPQGEGSLTLRERLAPLQVCHQMRAEAIGYFFDTSIWLVHALQARSEYHEAMVAPTEDEVKTWSTMIAKIPMHLRSPWLKFEYRRDERILSVNPLKIRKPLECGPEIKAGIGALIEAARPHGVIVVIEHFFHKIGSLPATRTRSTWPADVCVRDEPMTVTDCESILVRIPTSDATEAYRVVKRAFAEKRRRFEKHRSHRVCFVRLGLKVALERLEAAEKITMEAMEHLPGFPGPS